MTETQLHWLAGWLEGEGSFVATSGISPSNGKRYPRVRINGASTDQDVLTYIQSLVGGSVNGPYSRPGRKDYCLWSLCRHEDVLALLHQVKPLMIAQRRKDQVERAIEAAENYKAVAHGQKGDTDHGGL